MKRIAAMLLVTVCALYFGMSGALADKQQVNGYTQKNGTVVQPYEREAKSKKPADTVQVKGYTRKDGTVVKGYSRSKPTQAR